jgi:hypothetical protein
MSIWAGGVKTKWHINAFSSQTNNSIEIGSSATSGQLSIRSKNVSTNARLTLTSEDASVSYSGTINAYQFTCNGGKSNIIRIKETVSRTFERIIIADDYDNTIYTIINDSPNLVNFSFSSTKGYLRIPGGTRTIRQGECCSMMHWKNGLFSIF